MARNEGISITSLEVEGFKRVKAIRVEPTAEGITIIGGKNRQGKTSILDAIIWTLGGDKYKPTDPKYHDAETPPMIEIKLSNGLIVTRKGKNSSLTVTSDDGLTGGQTILNRFVEQLALDLPKFMGSTAKEKAGTLLQIIGAGEQLAELDDKEKMIFDNRRDAGRDADQAEAVLQSMTFSEAAGMTLISIDDLLAQVETADAEGRALEDKRRDRVAVTRQVETLTDQISNMEESLAACKSSKEDLIAERNLIDAEIETTTLTDADVLRQKLTDAESLNNTVRGNIAHKEQMVTASCLREDHAKLDLDLKSVRETRNELLDEADMPLDGLGVVDGELVYNGAHWDGMSSADQMCVATSIVQKLNPTCGFVLLDNLESMDIDTLRDFMRWVADKGLQVIATRVSTGDECSIIIEDGEAVQNG